MSENVLKLIPIWPHYVPNAAAVRTASNLLAQFFPEAEETASRLTDKVRFVDQGENWERVLCPVCGSKLDENWWQEAVDTAYITGFTDLYVDVPCCGARLSLNDLEYVWPAGFARFALEIRNPLADLNKEQLLALEQILGCGIRKVWAHY
jgi:hypothetical protein